MPTNAIETALEHGGNPLGVLTIVGVIALALALTRLVAVAIRRIQNGSSTSGLLRELVHRTNSIDTTLRNLRRELAERSVTHEDPD